MRKLSIENMEVKSSLKKVDSVIGASFERSTAVEEMETRMEEITPQSINGWTRLICF